MARQKSPRLYGLRPLMEDRIQQVVAERIDMDPGQLNGIIKLKRGASTPVIQKLVQYFSTTEERLIGVENSSAG